MALAISLLGLGASNAQQSALHVFGAEARQVRSAIMAACGSSCGWVPLARP
ncbi:hypothetical protein [Sphingobium yanoikuyae]|uniref:hypothetical protein n=1 Tax=Sphingobium yanoikuyae TaxID=13690 RepID=UPI002FD93BE3